MPEPTASPIIAVRELSVRLGGKLVLDRVSFDVRPGESLAIVGPNGAVHRYHVYLPKRARTGFRCWLGLRSVVSAAGRLDGLPIQAARRQETPAAISRVRSPPTEETILPPTRYKYMLTY